MYNELAVHYTAVKIASCSQRW